MKMDFLSLKPGDICPVCQEDGNERRLKNFLINLENEMLLKCESDSCMYPYNDDLTSSEDESLTDDGKEFETNFDIFIENSLQKNFDNHNLILKEENINKEEIKAETKELYFPLIDDKTDNKKPKETTLNVDLNSEHMIELKNESLLQFQPTTNAPIAKKTKIEIQSVTTITTQSKVTLQPAVYETPRSQENEKTQLPSGAGGCLPKASLIIGRQFLQHMEAMDKNKPFINPKVKASKTQNKKKKESITNNKTIETNTSKAAIHRNFDSVSQFLLNNIKNAKNPK